MSAMSTSSPTSGRVGVARHRHPVGTPPGAAAHRREQVDEPCVALQRSARHAVHHDRATGDRGDGQRVAGRRGVGLDAVRRRHVAPLVDLDRVVADAHVAATERRHHGAGHVDVRPRHERARQVDAKPTAQVGADQHQRRHELARDVTADGDPSAGGRSGDLDREPSRRRRAGGPMRRAATSASCSGPIGRVRSGGSPSTTYGPGPSAASAVTKRDVVPASRAGSVIGPGSSVPPRPSTTAPLGADLDRDPEHAEALDEGGGVVARRDALDRSIGRRPAPRRRGRGWRSTSIPARRPMRRPGPSPCGRARWPVMPAA